MCAEMEDHRKEEPEKQTKSIKDHLVRQNKIREIEQQVNEMTIKDLQAKLKSHGGTLAMIACYTVCMHTKCRCLSHEL